LYATARRIDQTNLFEQAVAKAFRYLGFDIQELGKRGETDLLAKPRLGPSSYSFIVDAKTQKDGKFSDLQPMTILSHQRAKKADFAVVIAEDFTGNTIKSFAQENNIVLLSLAVLEEWVLLHSRTPLNLITYKSMFEISGIIFVLPEKVQEESRLQVRLKNLIKRLVVFLARAHSITPDIRWTADLIHSHIAMEHYEERYTLHEIEEVLAFLSNPLIQGISSAQSGLVLALPTHNLSHLLRNLAASVEQV
jgi:hypothetical protein